MKIGIITHYYKSINYGGNLQAYALCVYLNNLGLDAEQISYIREKNSVWKKKSFLRKIAVSIYHAVLKLRSFKHLKAWLSIEKRKRRVLEFNLNRIPHSKTIYTQKTIHQANTDYQIFITGSDQVWHPQAVCHAYLLDFVSDGHKKISYAASLSVDELTEKQKAVYQYSLKTYHAISVREEMSVSLLQPIMEQSVKWVLDPTLLLSKEEWDVVCAQRIIGDDYIFCYFLGDGLEQREIAKKFAERKKIKIVTLPYLNGKYRTCDHEFGDEKLFAVGPEEFLSLIRYAKYVFTDSFHASVFSLIYMKEFFTFERTAKQRMGSRLDTLFTLFDCKSHFCDTKDKANLQYIMNLPAIDYTKKLPKFEEMKEKSINFLKENLKD